ncbi:coiled-coil domain-containing protein 50 isoform X1 [Stigmatopora argus]
MGDDMAECNVSIDQDKLPGVKEVCRDFAVLEDHSLAYNLQEQEIESHLASNVHKSRLVQHDLQVAKKLQEEEDEIAKVVIKNQHVAIARQDNEIAHEIQDELVRQAEQQRLQQEEKDAAFARKMHEKEMKEERRRQKQLDEEYYEDTVAARQLLDLDRATLHTSSSAGRHDMYSPVSSQREQSPDYNSMESKRSRYPKQDLAEHHSRARYPEHSLPAEGGKGRFAEPYPDHPLPDKGRHGDRHPDYEPVEFRRTRDLMGEDPSRVVKKKERTAHSPLSPREREQGWERERDRDRRYERDHGREVERDSNMRKHKSDRDQDMRSGRGGREGERFRDGEHGEDRPEARDKQTHKSKDTQRARARSRERVLYDDSVEPRVGRTSREEEEDDARWDRRRQRIQSGPDEVFEEHRNKEGRGNREKNRENRTPSSGETGRIVQKGSGAVIDPEYGLGEATRDLTKLDLREQELKDLEVARRLQQEEVKASKSHVHAAQVAQDEEMARQLMEQEKKEYRKHREREKERERDREEKEREREKEHAMEKRRPEGDYRPNSEDVVRPRTRDDYDHQRHRNHHKPSRPPHPRTHDYENVNPSYGYAEHASQRAPARPDAAYKGAYYKR